MTDIVIDQFRRSLNRCRDNPRFMERFYHLFINSSPDIQKKFARTDWERQYQMVVDSFEHMTDTDRTWSDDDPHLSRLADVHGASGQAIPAWMFDNWVDCLLQAVQETDPSFDDDVAAAWRKVMWQGIAFMKARYNRARA